MLGVCGQVDRVLDLGSKSLGYYSHYWSCKKEKCRANCSFDAASVNPAVIGIWWSEKCKLAVIGTSRRKCADLIPKGDETVNECVAVPGL